MKTVIIIGSSRKNGETQTIVEKIISYSNIDVIDLNDFKIGHYDYTYKQQDDYLPLMKELILKYDTFVFATPVYWYSMSGIMKVFFDRFTDILDLEQELGRKLRGKNMAAISTSNGNNLGDNFWLPFAETANYLGMTYLGNAHFINDQKSEKTINEFVDLIKINNQYN